MSHHEALAVIERGGCVVSLFHSNSERGYLDAVMKDRLRIEIEGRWEGRMKEEMEKLGEVESEESEVVRRVLSDEKVEVLVSRRDRDPFGIVVLQESTVEGEAVG